VVNTKVPAEYKIRDRDSTQYIKVFVYASREDNLSFSCYLPRRSKSPDVLIGASVHKFYAVDLRI